MLTYYCKNCNNIIGKWNDINKYYDILTFCCITESLKFDSINFLDCINCNKFVGILCFFVCKNCFGKNYICDIKKMFNWFQQYKKITYYIYDLSYLCKNCDNKKFRSQHWFFEELTYYK